MKRASLNKLSCTIAVMVLCATAPAVPALAQHKQETPGYDDKIPAMIVAAAKLKAPSRPSPSQCAEAERRLRDTSSSHTHDLALWSWIRARCRKLGFSSS